MWPIGCLPRIAGGSNQRANGPSGKSAHCVRKIPVCKLGSFVYVFSLLPTACRKLCLRFDSRRCWWAWHFSKAKVLCLGRCLQSSLRRVRHDSAMSHCREECLHPVLVAVHASQDVQASRLSSTPDLQAGNCEGFVLLLIFWCGVWFACNACKFSWEVLLIVALPLFGRSMSRASSQTLKIRDDASNSYSRNLCDSWDDGWSYAAMAESSLEHDSTFALPHQIGDPAAQEGAGGFPLLADQARLLWWR